MIPAVDNPTFLRPSRPQSRSSLLMSPKSIETPTYGGKLGLQPLSTHHPLILLVRGPPPFFFFLLFGPNPGSSLAFRSAMPLSRCSNRHRPLSLRTLGPLLFRKIPEFASPPSTRAQMRPKFVANSDPSSLRHRLPLSSVPEFNPLCAQRRSQPGALPLSLSPGCTFATSSRHRLPLAFLIRPPHAAASLAVVSILNGDPDEKPLGAQLNAYALCCNQPHL